MGAGSKTQIRGVPGADDWEANVTGRALWVRIVSGSGSSVGDVNGTPQFINGGTGDGRPIALNNSTFVTVHTVPVGSRDRVRLYAGNYGGVDAALRMLIGGAASSDEANVFSPAREVVPVLDGHFLGEGQAVQLKLPTGSTATVNIFGDVERFTP